MLVFKMVAIVMLFELQIASFAVQLCHFLNLLRNFIRAKRKELSLPVLVPSYWYQMLFPSLHVDHVLVICTANGALGVLLIRDNEDAFPADFGLVCTGGVFAVDCG